MKFKVGDKVGNVFCVGCHGVVDSYDPGTQEYTVRWTCTVDPATLKKINNSSDQFLTEEFSDWVYNTHRHG